VSSSASNLCFGDLLFEGSELLEAAIPDALPPELVALLHWKNGFVAFRGGLHVRGWCSDPEWHSLPRCWSGKNKLSSMYPVVSETDIPFGQDCMADQFLLRGGQVMRLSSELGEIKELGLGLLEFLELACTDPVSYLSLEPLLAYESSTGQLRPGRLLMAVPPFCLKSGRKSEIRSAQIGDLMAYLSGLASQIASLPDGTSVALATSEVPREDT